MEKSITTTFTGIPIMTALCTELTLNLKATRQIVHYVLAVADLLAGQTVRSLAPELPPPIAATDTNTGSQRCSPPVEQSLAGKTEVSVALAQLPFKRTKEFSSKTNRIHGIPIVSKGNVSPPYCATLIYHFFLLFLSSFKQSTTSIRTIVSYASQQGSNPWV
jgi:hypothetical protein